MGPKYFSSANWWVVWTDGGDGCTTPRMYLISCLLIYSQHCQFCVVFYYHFKVILKPSLAECRKWWTMPQSESAGKERFRNAEWLHASSTVGSTPCLFLWRHLKAISRQRALGRSRAEILMPRILSGRVFIWTKISGCAHSSRMCS